MADSRQLIPKVRGQVQAQPDAGWGMSAAQNDLPAGIDFIRQLVKKFTNPNDPMQPMAMENPVMAMIPSVGNLPIFKQKMEEASKNLLQEWDMPSKYNAKAIADAIAFAKTRYPNMTGLVQKFNPVANHSSRYGEVGRYMPDIKEALVSFRNPNGTNISPEEMVSTAVHESRHALSHKRTPGIFFDAFNNNPGSLDTLEEQRAYGAGDTAAWAFRRFMKLLETEGQK